MATILAIVYIAFLLLSSKLLSDESVDMFRVGVLSIDKALVCGLLHFFVEEALVFVIRQVKGMLNNIISELVLE